MLERTDAIMNEVLEPIMFVLAYPTYPTVQCLSAFKGYEISILLGCGATSLCDRSLIFLRQYGGLVFTISSQNRTTKLSQKWAPVAKRCSTTSQKNGDLSCTAAKAY